MKPLYPDYTSCIVNVSNSILKYYGVKNTHPTIPELDLYLEKDYKNVVVLLYDGFGSNLLAKHKDELAFLNTHKIKDITSVFPATTTASTTSMISGLTPMEHCWLGWDNYIKSIDEVVTMYLNVIKHTQTKIADYSISMQEFPYITILDKINEVNQAKAYAISPFNGIYYNINILHEMYDKLTELCLVDERKFIYVY